MRPVILVLVFVATSLSADTEIYRCALEDGTFAFQEKPCPEPDTDADVEKPAEIETPAVKDDFFDFVNPFDEPTSSEKEVDATLPEPVSQDRAECEKVTRDAIDAIDLEMRQTDYSKEQGREYLAELRVLTQQLRACKQL